MAKLNGFVWLCVSNSFIMKCDLSAWVTGNVHIIGSVLSPCLLKPCQGSINFCYIMSDSGANWLCFYFVHIMALTLSFYQQMSDFSDKANNKRKQ